ncbi:MAG: hypothetical protein NTY65_14700 [Planctomycetota bacterium]|nr:hypothetical protein [Planctomycetota bacterium]
MLALSETRLTFWGDGLTMTAWAVMLVGTLVFWGLLVHWVLVTRSWRLAPLLLLPPLLALVGWLTRRDEPSDSPPGTGGAPQAADTEPILPWWQVLVGFALAGMLAPMTLAAGRSDEASTQLALMILVTLTCAVWVLFFYLRVFAYVGRLPMALLLALRIVAILLLVLLIFKPLLSFEERQERRTDLYLLSTPPSRCRSATTPTCPTAWAWPPARSMST